MALNDKDSFRFIQGRLDVQLYASRARVSAELAARMDLSSMVDSVTQDLIISIQTSVYETAHESVRLDDDTLSVELPWSCEAVVEVPRPWWRRWVGMSARLVSVPVSGVVIASGRIEHRAEHRVRFPELDSGLYPVQFGAPVSYIRRSASVCPESVVVRPSSPDG